LQIHVYAGARQRARERAKTPEFGIALRARKKVEALFAELKNQIGLRRRAPAPDEVRAGAVLPGGRGTEPETAGAVPRPNNTADGVGNNVKKTTGNTRKTSWARATQDEEDATISMSFSTATLVDCKLLSRNGFIADHVHNVRFIAWKTI